MAAAAIQCESLTKRFGSSRAVERIDLRVEPGEAFGFVGPNGAGKTTTIRALLGFLRPTAGSCAVFGHDSWRSAVEVHRVTGNLPGDFSFDRTMTGRQIVAHIARLRELGTAELAYAAELAERLSADLDRPLGDLSRGNHQKIGLIQAMFHRPKLLVLDEPTSGLDPLMQELFIELVQEARDAGATVFLSSHYLAEVERTCQRVGIIREGKLVATEDVETLAANALRHVDVRFEGTPPPVERLRDLPGAREVKLDGDHATLRMSGNLDPLVELLAEFTISDLSVQRASLEELFLSFYGEGESAEDASNA